MSFWTIVQAWKLDHPLFPPHIFFFVRKQKFHFNKKFRPDSFPTLFSSCRCRDKIFWLLSQESNSLHLSWAQSWAERILILDSSEFTVLLNERVTLMNLCSAIFSGQTMIFQVLSGCFPGADFFLSHTNSPSAQPVSIFVSKSDRYTFRFFEQFPKAKNSWTRPVWGRRWPKKEPFPDWPSFPRQS